MLFNEPKLLKSISTAHAQPGSRKGFSALQRAEIAEIVRATLDNRTRVRVSVLFNEPKLLKFNAGDAFISVNVSFSALQRAEIAEIVCVRQHVDNRPRVSVLFNEPKLLKSRRAFSVWRSSSRFSALQRAEIAEIDLCCVSEHAKHLFQCSSTSRNC